MNRFVATAALTLLALLQSGCSANSPGEQQTLVDRATLTVQDMMTQTVSQDPKDLLRRAKAVMICPRIFKAGFFFGGEGGNCVMLARAGNGTWSYPAFYTIGSGSFGFQFGIEDNQLLMLIMTERGLNAVLDSQIKLGANAGIAVATLGAGIQGSTTTAVGADIVAYAASRGLFGGVALEGSVMSTQTSWDQSYYGQPYAARQLVMQMQGGNPGADPLRDVLTRYGTRNANFAPPSSSAYAPPRPPPGYAPPPPGYAPPQPNYAPPQPTYAPPQSSAYAPSQPPPGYAPAYPPQGGQQPGGQQPGYAPSQPPQGYAPGYPPQAVQQQPPSGGYAASPPGDRGPLQEQSLPPPGH
jgi:lipid-binding SYLF domain-containing protein